MRIQVLVVWLILAGLPGPASAQGRQGRQGRERGSRGERDQGDSAATRVPRPRQSLADVVYAHRSELQLSDSQRTRVADIRMVALSRTASLDRQLDSLHSAMIVSPAEAATPPSDSSRKATIATRRALASVLGQLHDVELDARNQTLALLSADQQKKAQQLELAANSPPVDRGAQSGGARSGSRHRGGMDGGNGVPF